MDKGTYQLYRDELQQILLMYDTPEFSDDNLYHFTRKNEESCYGR